MKNLWLIPLLTAAPVLAQPIVSPDVHADGSITFRLKAPNAKEVQLRGEAGDAAMTRDDQGIWSFTTKTLDPDIYVYSFNVDGLHRIDPANSFIKYNLLNIDSQALVPGPKSLPWEINDVPHGTLHRHFYHSSIGGDDRDFIVYTPPGYDARAKARYPVLYLLHGYSDDTTAWTEVGRANVILDNLIARGQARPMIVVMPLGYGTMDIVKTGWSSIHNHELWQRNVDQFGDALRGEVMPQVERLYTLSPDRELHAIAGLSMGGTESLAVGLNHLDYFAWIGAFSSGGLNTNFAKQYPRLDAKVNSQIRLLWIGCGREDGLIGSNLQLCDWLKSQDVHYTWVESAGAHSFRVWRRYLAEFAPLLFQGKSAR